MKFFRCQNEECPSYTPRSARENNVLAEVTLVFPMTFEGEIDYDGQPKLGDISYLCGTCGDVAEELESSELVRCRIVEAKDEILVGEFQSFGRGKAVFHFACNISTKDVQVKEGIVLWDHEAYHILEHCQKMYSEYAIQVMLLDCDPNQKPKVYTLQVQNLAENIFLDVEATEDRIISTSGRSLNHVEEEKVFRMIEQTPL